MKKSFTCTASFQLSLSEENSWKRIGTQTENETTKMKVVPVLPEQNADLDFAKQFSRRQYFQSPPYICKNAETKKVAKSRTWKEFLTSELVFCTRFGFCKIIFKANADTDRNAHQTKKNERSSSLTYLTLTSRISQKIREKTEAECRFGFCKTIFKVTTKQSSIYVSDLTGEFSGRWLLQSLFFLDESEFRFWQIFRSFLSKRQLL